MILIAESGSSKTDWCVLGDSIQRFETIGLNPYFTDEATIISQLSGKIESNQPISRVYFYGTGITDEQKAGTIKRGITKALGYETHIETYSDIVAAARAAFGSEGSGLVGILGTGSNSCFWQNDAIAYQIPPLGFWLGDEGSGGNLGKMLILSYLHSEMPAEIKEKFEAEYGRLSRVEILQSAYQLPRPNKYFAAFTPFLNQNLAHDFIQGIVDESFENYVKKYLFKYPMIKTHSITFVGSVAVYFEKSLIKICEKHNIKIQKIIQKPIDSLIEYHKKNL